MYGATVDIQLGRYLLKKKTKGEKMGQESAVEVFQRFKDKNEIDVSLEAPNFKSLLSRIGSKGSFEGFVSFLEQWRNTNFGVAHSEGEAILLSPVIIDTNQHIWRITAINRPNGWFVGASEL